MKKLAIIFLSLIFIPVVLGYCEFSDIEKFTERGEALCLQGSNVYHARSPIISGFVNGTQPSFTVQNPNEFAIKLYFNYSIAGSVSATKFYGVTIGAHDARIIQDVCFANDAWGNCSIDPASIDYFSTDPRRMEKCITDIPMKREVCNKPCVLDSDCATSFCNIAGFCGIKKVVPCPDGKTNCRDIACLPPAQKVGGESYQCDFECKSGIGSNGVCKENDGGECRRDIDCVSGICNAAHQCGKNITCPAGTDNCKDAGCFAPSTKKYNEPYMCEWECKSDRGFNGVCQISTSSFIIYSALLIMIFAASLWYFLFKKRREEENRLETLQKERKEVEAQITKDNYHLEKMENSLVALSNKERELQKKVASAEGDAKRRLEEELEKYKESYEKKLNDLVQTFTERSNNYTVQIREIENQLNHLKSEEEQAREKIKTAKGQAKIDYEEEYARLREENKQKQEELKGTKKALEEQEFEMRQKEEELKQSRERIKEQSYETHIERLTEEYRRRYQTSRVTVNYKPESRRFFVKFSDDSKEYPFHRYVYYKDVDSEFKFKKDEREVHHIDYDQLNNEPWNLIVIIREEHKNISHAKIKKGDWQSGIKQLKSALDVNDAELPPHIKEHFNVDVKK